MTNQTNEAAERSAHVTRGEKPAPAKWPVVRMPDGTWKLKSVVALQARIAELEAALATARRDALAEIKQDTDELIEQGRKDGLEQAAQIAELIGGLYGAGVAETVSRAIRAALEEGKKDG